MASQGSSPAPKPPAGNPRPSSTGGGSQSMGGTGDGVKTSSDQGKTPGSGSSSSPGQERDLLGRTDGTNRPTAQSPGSDVVEPQGSAKETGSASGGDRDLLKHPQQDRTDSTVAKSPDSNEVQPQNLVKETGGAPEGTQIKTLSDGTQLTPGSDDAPRKVTFFAADKKIEIEIKRMETDSDGFQTGFDSNNNEVLIIYPDGNVMAIYHPDGRESALVAYDTDGNAIVGGSTREESAISSQDNTNHTNSSMISISETTSDTSGASHSNWRRANTDSASRPGSDKSDTSDASRPGSDNNANNAGGDNADKFFEKLKYEAEPVKDYLLKQVASRLDDNRLTPEQDEKIKKWLGSEEFRNQIADLYQATLEDAQERIQGFIKATNDWMDENLPPAQRPLNNAYAEFKGALMRALYEKERKKANIRTAGLLAAIIAAAVIHALVPAGPER